jgi:hypothetical protein
MLTFEVGDIIEYEVIGTSDHKRIILVSEKSNNIKNGRAGFAGDIVDGRNANSYWGYSEDITRVWKAQ